MFKIGRKVPKNYWWAPFPKHNKRGEEIGAAFQTHAEKNSMGTSDQVVCAQKWEGKAPIGIS